MEPVTENTSSLDPEIKSLIRMGKGTLVAFAVVVVGLVFAYLINLGTLQASSKVGDWGATGDFFGGFLNPLVAFVAVVWLIISVSMTKHEMALARKEMELARGEMKTSNDGLQQTIQHNEHVMQIESLRYFIKMADEYLHANLRSDFVLVRQGEPSARNVGEHIMNWGKAKASTFSITKYLSDADLARAFRVHEQMKLIGWALVEMGRLERYAKDSYPVRFYVIKYHNVFWGLNQLEEMPSQVKGLFGEPPS
ncbi:hypothetical protein [Aliikangiella coralliicola]|uniref:DUF4760 domain-containing protein n=1 Tax=Aliikangiella coralliicola TaxID=2592383 RepID=A0A545UJA2_9GAMM|nr:hypothetical protein [Aliikangiella coralliicola]TQV89538.1 hypothetical protein FLL46_01245 [Aliikangiella coralliicola]